MPYLKARVQDFGLPNFVNRLVPITEFSFKTETSNFDENEPTTGTVNPGLLYVADKYQLGVEAIIPISVGEWGWRRCHRQSPPLP
jgi:hypothetical protein